MHVSSEEQHYQRLRARPGPLRAYGEKPDPKRPFTYSSGFDFSEKGIQAMLDVRLKDLIDPRSGHATLCTTNHIKRELDGNDRSWNAFNSAQVNPKTEMHGRWLDKRNFLRARRRLCEEECRFLHKLLAEAEQAEKVKRESRKPLGVVKLKDGQPWRVDGRELVETKNGEYMIADTGVLLKNYIAEAVANRGKRFAKAAAETAPACAGCE